VGRFFVLHQRKAEFDSPLLNAENEELRLVMIMDPKTVEKLEEMIEEAIAEIIVKMGIKKLPLLPARHTMHLMAKAAVSVYEAAVENQRREEDR